MAARSKAEGSLRSMLSGGDRRSIAQAKRALALVQANPSWVSALARLAEDDDWLVSMRAMDLLEKVAQVHPDWVQPHKRLFIGALADSEAWEIRLQVVRALPLLKWTPRERKRVVDILCRDIAHQQKFVRAWALDGLATFALADQELMPIVMRAVANFERSTSSALRTRARHVRKRIATDV